jgi:hypothetical protein
MDKKPLTPPSSPTIEDCYENRRNYRFSFEKSLSPYGKRFSESEEILETSKFSIPSRKRINTSDNVLMHRAFDSSDDEDVTATKIIDIDEIDVEIVDCEYITKDQIRHS